jgi:GxxExxY protein
MHAKDEIETLIRTAFDCGMKIHMEVGPGLLESVYERVLADRLRKLGIRVDQQQPINVEVDGICYPDAFRYDLLLNEKLIIEVKSVERLGPVHIKQTLTYIRFMRLPFGLNFNFGAETFKQGMRRVINDKIKIQRFAPLFLCASFTKNG